MGIIANLKYKFGAIGEMMRTTGSIGQSYILDSSKVDYELARKLYQNKDDRYKLGSSFVRPIINSTVGFMGVPSFSVEDENAKMVLDEFVLENTSKMMKTHTNATKLGDCYIWLTREERENPLYPEKKTRIIYNFIPPEEVKDIIIDPVTKEPKAYLLESKQEWEDLDGTKRSAIIKQTITKDNRVIDIQGDCIDGLEIGELTNTWGFIPIIHFKNEPDETMKHGQSDIEPIEPLMKAYHDVMLHALKGSKMHSTPKLKLKLKDVAGFLRNNFAIDDPVKFAKQGGKVSLEGQEMIFLTENEDASFIEVSSATGGAQVLLKLLFYCIVDVSETPEFIFGVHTPSALASVKEQMPIMVNKIRRKREQFVEQWQLLARMVLVMSANGTGINYSSYNVTIGWDEINPRDDKELAETLDKLASAMDKALEGGFISEESAVDFLTKYIDTMNKYVSDDPEIMGEREKIIQTRVMRQRMENASDLIDEEDSIQSAINKANNGESDE